MDLEASIVERLQQLKQRQLKEQEQLLKQQQIQREMLTQEQNCICKVLEQSLQELDVNGSTLHKNNSNKVETNIKIDNKDIIELHNKSQEKKNYAEMVNNNESCINQNENNFKNIVPQQSLQEKLIEEADALDNHFKKQSRGKIMSDAQKSLTLSSSKQEKEKEIEQFIMDGVALLPCNKVAINHVSIDDVPIPSPNKDFHTLLEERLKDSENEYGERSNSNSGKVKKPFLRKGEGLSRFKVNRNLEIPAIKKKSCSASFFTNTRSHYNHSKNKSRHSNTTQPVKNTQSTKNVHHATLSQKRLSLKDVPLPKKKVRSKSESSTLLTPLKNYITETKSTIDLNTSDFHSGTQKEMEEVRIFELLEEKAENSSFCSTSSAVLAFLQQTTPFKIKQKGHNVPDDTFNAKQASPTIKNLMNQSVSKSNQTLIHAISNKTNDSCNFESFVNQNALQDTTENSKMNTNKRKHVSLKNQIQSVHSQQNSYNISNSKNDNEADVSLHVRFSEYNEYKTIGLTDTSNISTESLITKVFTDEKVWSDSSTPEISDTETSSVPFEIPQSPTIVKFKLQNNNFKTKFEQCNVQELNCEEKNIGGTHIENDFNCYKDTDQYVYHSKESEYADSNQFFDEQSILYEYSKKSSTSQEINTSYSSKNSQNLKACDNSKVDKCVGNCNDIVIIEDQKDQRNFQETNETIFKSELLKNRLLELEQEINIFRKENTALSIQRKKLQEDHRNLHKEYAEKEKNLEENRKQMEDRLQEERKKLAREKAALENRIRDSQEKAQQNKLERQEIHTLKQELEKLKDDIHVKESRWNAAQSRHKCQIRILKMENSKLKQEIERLQSLKKTNIRNKGKSGILSNTKAIHRINKQLNKECQKNNDNSSSDDNDQKLVESMIEVTGMTDIQDVGENDYNCNNNKSVIHEELQKRQTHMVNLARKRNLYENLIKEATSDLTIDQNHSQTVENLNVSKTDLNDKLKKVNKGINTLEGDFERSNKDFNVVSYNHVTSKDNVSLQAENDYVHFITPTRMSHEGLNQKPISIISDELPLSDHVKSIASPCQNSSNIDKQDIRQIQYPDGRIEYWYPNGNVKKIFPDEGLTKLIYYNGDVRETNKDGKVKYFYASSCTWHTTMPDGIEILEFVDGQVEKRLCNGTVEISFPDGSVRIVESDGFEKWTLPNGTMIQTFTNGEKILTLPNGQKEIHTKNHKRREYPDGTVKLIYPDGTQETRYSNGRIRLKDKDGNLLMDSYE